jgi:hypothetical protein
MEMQKAKTHYEQVSLHLVKKILADELPEDALTVKTQLQKHLKLKATMLAPGAGVRAGGRS